MEINNANIPYQKPYFGHSSVIKKVKGEVDVVAMSDCAALIIGETGTGKGLTARWIHDNSPRKGCAFVDINCAGLGGELLKSELFGHALGSFTGAVRDRPGLIEMANGGTLFLDEIGDMDISVQCLMLKAIEEKTYRRIGENRLRTSDFRLICATHRNLLDAVDKGTFREDLYHRINTVEISIPPLRERVDDLPELVEHILKSMGYDRFPVCSDVMEELARRLWRGNIRELRNTLERALVFAQSEDLALEHLPEIRRAENAGPIVTLVDPERVELLRDVWDLNVIERVHINRALAHFGDDKVKMAAALGISLSSLYRRLNELRKESACENVIEG